MSAKCQKRKLGPFADAADRARSLPRRAGQAFSGGVGAERHVLVLLRSVLEAYIRRIGIYDAELGHDCLPRSPYFDCVAKPYFAGSSLILSPPFATGSVVLDARIPWGRDHGGRAGNRSVTAG